MLTQDARSQEGDARDGDPRDEPSGAVVHVNDGELSVQRAVLRNALDLLSEVPDGTPVEGMAGAVPVPSGVGHLVARQREGWAYLRP